MENTAKKGFWGTFKEKHPAVAQFIVFFIISNGVTVLQMIMMPITKPAFASMAILCAMGSWNNMLWPMLVFRDTSKFTLQIGLNTLLTPYGNNYNLLIAGSMFGILPILIIYLIFQRYLIDGMTSGAVKG